MENSKRSKPKTFGQLPIDRMTDHDVANVVADALGADYGEFKSTAKRIANDAGASEKTAGNWVGAMNTPCLLHFLRLYARSPQLQAEVRRLTAAEADLDAGLGPDLARFVQTALGNP